MKFKYADRGVVHVELSARDLRTLGLLLKNPLEPILASSKESILENLAHFSKALISDYEDQTRSLNVVFGDDNND